MSGYDGYQDHDGDYDEPGAEHERPARGRGGMGGATPLGAGLAGLLVGALLAGIVLIAVGGKPFYDANDVTYREIVIEDISDAGDQVCWAREPGRRDAPQDCAILAIDPAAAQPEEGERVTIGLGRLRPPEGDSVLQVVYVRGSAPAESPAEPGEENPGDGASTEGDEASSPDATDS